MKKPAKGLEQDMTNKHAEQRKSTRIPALASRFASTAQKISRCTLCVAALSTELRFPGQTNPESQADQAAHALTRN
jgi:hypothetical protein